MRTEAFLSDAFIVNKKLNWEEHLDPDELLPCD